MSKNKVPHFFLITERKSDGNRLVSPLSFPEEEVKRRIKGKGPLLKRRFRFFSAAAPKSHPRWNPELDNVVKTPLEDLRTYCNLGQRILEEHDYYGLKEGGPK